MQQKLLSGNSEKRNSLAWVTDTEVDLAAAAEVVLGQGHVGRQRIDELVPVPDLEGGVVSPHVADGACPLGGDGPVASLSTPSLPGGPHHHPRKSLYCSGRIT